MHIKIWQGNLLKSNHVGNLNLSQQQDSHCGFLDCNTM